MKTGGTVTREVPGVTFEMRPNGSMQVRTQTLVFRITRSRVGASISLNDEERGIMLEIPLEPVEDLFHTEEG